MWPRIHVWIKRPGTVKGVGDMRASLTALLSGFVVDIGAVTYAFE
jgi:hypothetical protein